MLDAKALKADADRLLSNKDFDGSRALYERLIQVPEFRASSYYGLAVIAHQMSRFDEAQRNLNACLAIEPRASNAYYLLGDIAEREANAVVARAMYSEALKLAPDFGKAKERLAVLEAASQAQRAPLSAPNDAQPEPRSDTRPVPNLRVGSNMQVVRVVSVQQRQTSLPNSTWRRQATFCWDMRLQPTDDGGVIAARICASDAFVGSIIAGDYLAIPKNRAESGSLESVDNLTTGSPVRNQRTRSDFAGRSGSRTVRCEGVVSAYQERFESFWPMARGQAMLRNRIVDFRIPRPDGNATPFLQVEMVGMDFTSSINNGDIVEFESDLGDGRIARPRTVLNKTTGANVTAIGEAGTQTNIPFVIGLVIFLAFLAFIIFVWIPGMHLR